MNRSEPKDMNPAPALLVSVLMIAFQSGAGESHPALAFDSGPGPAKAGFVKVWATNMYSPNIGYGFEPGASNLVAEQRGRGSLRDGFILSKAPFSFSVAVPEGNYRVTVHLAGGVEGSTASVKAELRRLMLEKVRVAPGQAEARAFVVNVRTPNLVHGGEVRLKDRERTMESWAWDEKLTLEFNGILPAIARLQIARADDLPTVYLLGD